MRWQIHGSNTFKLMFPSMSQKCDLNVQFTLADKVDHFCRLGSKPGDGAPVYDNVYGETHPACLLGALWASLRHPKNTPKISVQLPSSHWYLVATPRVSSLRLQPQYEHISLETLVECFECIDFGAQKMGEGAPIYIYIYTYYIYDIYYI